MKIYYTGPWESKQNRKNRAGVEGLQETSAKTMLMKMLLIIIIIITMVIILINLKIEKLFCIENNIMDE